MASFNRVIVAGNLTRDIELRWTAGGTAVCDLGLAINDRVKRGEEWVDEATFVDVTVWGRTAEVAAEHLSKGSNVLIEGRLKLDTWETDGQRRSKIKIICENLRMLGGKRDGSGGGSRSSGSGRNERPPQDDEYAPSGSSGSRSAPPPQDDDIPFAWLVPLAAATLAACGAALA